MNRSPYNQVQIKWLIDPDAHGADALPSANFNHLRIQCPYPASMGEGWVNRLSLSPDIEIYQTVHRFSMTSGPQMLPLGEFKLDYSQPTLSVHALHSGSATSRELQQKADLAFKPGEDLFRYGEQGHFIPFLNTASNLEMTALVLTQSALLELMGDDAAQQLLDGLGLRKPPMAKVAAIPLHVTEPLRQSLMSGSTGTLHTLYAQSKVLDYLWRLATFAGGAVTAGKFSVSGGGSIQALHDYLLHLEGEMPTLKDLAKKFGTSAQCLNKGFVREYGHSIYSMLTSHRLNQAHQALVDGKLPIKTIATRMGYSHVNHFSHAFKMKFGCTPGSLRRT